MTQQAENTEFSLPDGVEWGATSEQLLAAVGKDAQVEKYDEAAFITIDDASALGSNVQMTYILPYDRLFAWGFTASLEALSVEQVTIALTSKYGDYREPNIALIKEMFSPFDDGEGLVNIDVLFSASVHDCHIWDTQADAYVLMLCEGNEINVLFVGRQVAPVILEAREKYEKAKAEKSRVFDEADARGIIAAMREGYANAAKKYEDLMDMQENILYDPLDFQLIYENFKYTLPTDPETMGVVPEIVLETASQVLTIPESALEFDGDDTFVYKKNAEGGYERVQVQTGLSDGVDIEIKSGLNQGDKVRGPKIIKTEENEN